MKEAATVEEERYDFDEIDKEVAEEIVENLPPIPRTEFITGEAGTGKTWLVRERAKKYPGHVLCATTGIAAVNLGEGVTTINSLLGYFDTASLRDAWTAGYAETKLMNLVDKAGVRQIVIDEVSMLDADQLWLLTQLIDSVNERRDAAGLPGVGITLVADFCLALGTMVMMSDGTLLSVEEVKVGMQVMGTNSEPRTVLQTTQGISNLYRIKQTNGDDYVVTENHTLIMTRTASGKAVSRFPNMGDTIGITPKQLMDTSGKFKDCFAGFKEGVVKLPEREISIDPYFLGLWLGDGSHDGLSITTADQEIIEYVKLYAKKLGLRFKLNEYNRIPKTPAVDVSIRKWEGGNSLNSLWEEFKVYSLVKNKHIPEDFLLNSEENRLQLLAGLLDTDGSWGGNRYTFTVAHEVLAKQVKQLADQLGFRAHLAKLACGYYANGANGGAWSVTIGGDTWRIPCKIARKKSVERNLGRSRMTSTLKVIPEGPGKFAGFEVDGDKLFLLADGTITHNCQLGPIKAKFAFQSDVWERYSNNTTKLFEIHRQADKPFIEALQATRIGDGKKALVYFRNTPGFQQQSDSNFDGVTILAKNDEVDRFNLFRLSKLQGAQVQFGSAREGKDRPEWKQIPEKLDLKIGCLVMILSNKKLVEGQLLYANGDIGELVEVQGNQALVKLKRNDTVVPVEYVRRDNKIPLEPGRRKELKEQGKENCIAEKYEIVGSVTYMPLRVAFASTVHKTQGLSMDRVQIDFRGSFFGNPGSLYVALSRARTAAGLRLVGSEATFLSRCKTSKEVAAWL